MTRVLAPIQEELVHLREGLQVVGAAVKAVEASNLELKDAVEDLQDSNALIHRIAAIVEPLTPSFHWFVVDQMQTWNRTSGNGKDTPLEVQVGALHCTGPSDSRNEYSVSDHPSSRCGSASHCETLSIAVARDCHGLLYPAGY